MSIESRSRQYGKIAGHWQIREFLGSGSGGKSAVFRLVHSDSGSVQSALKVVNLIERRGDLDSLTESRRAEYECVKQESKNFAEQEVLLMNKLQGRTNIVAYSDHTFVDWADETGFGCDMLIRMELLTDLRTEIEAERRFDQEDILKIGRDICTALVLCHGKNILHRDIKPENIFCNEDGNYKLGDFGVSRILSAVPMSKASTSVCTPEYAAPEQLYGEYDKRVDIYSLGLVLYELSNRNRLPFATSSYARQEDIQKRQMGTPLPKPEGISEGLWCVLQKACAYKAADRYSTAREFLEALCNLSGEQISVRVQPNRTQNQTVRATEMDTRYGTQKAEDLAKWNATQYAGAGTEVWSNDNETVSVKPANLKKELTPPPSTKEKRKKGILVGVFAGIAAVFAVALLFWFREQHEHTWIDATCTAPRTCEECGETEGSALGHRWLDASCDQARFCSVCGATDGTALGHRWIDATCTAPKICNVCQKIEGPALDHQWIDATYQTPQTCSMCGVVQGESLSALWMRHPLETPTGIISVSPGGWSTYALTNQGRVCAIGRNQDGQTNVSHWSDVVDISGGDRHLAVLHEDGTVDAIGRWEHGQCDVHSWRDIIDISAGVFCTVGICEDGTVKLAGQCSEVAFDVSDWTNIVQVDVTDYFIVGLRTDGTVVYTGGNGHEGESDYYKNYYKYNRNGNKEEIEAWKDIVAVAAGSYHTLGLRSDGTVVATTPKEGEYAAACDVSDWENIVAISAGASFSVGLRRDGTVVIAGDFCDKDIITKWRGNIHTAESWKDIIQIEAVYNQIVGLTKDGYIVACGFNSHGQCDAADLQRKVFESLR